MAEKYVGVICEFDPFTSGHAFLFKQIREKYPDAGIVCVMSGNFTQRADAALFDKFDRARAAVECGASLVLELPFPYCASSANRFAFAGVSILAALDGVDTVAFGAESEIKLLSAVSARVLEPEFTHALKTAVGEDSSRGYAKCFDETYRAVYPDSPEEADALRSPNNILALEYMRALKTTGAKLDIFSVVRRGDYHSTGVSAVENAFMSATALRNAITGGDLASARAGMPYEAAAELLGVGVRRYRMKNAERFIIPYLRTLTGRGDFADCAGGLGDRIFEAARGARTLEAMLAGLSTKKYTDARIRRALLYMLTGIKSGTPDQKPAYTQLLAADGDGLALLGRNRRNKAVKILTKPADRTSLPADAAEQTSASFSADELHMLCGDEIEPYGEFLRRTPYIIKRTRLGD